ncbi:putative phage tail assembly chaperone [Serratia marcescens]
MAKTTDLITLTIAGNDVSFEPNLQAYNKCLNESARDEDVIGAVNTYLKRIVTPESREVLLGLLLTPGAGAQIAKKVNELYAPSLEIEVKS